jgi:hypothetical protein
MTNDEAKFMLQGYRPNGQDADNEAFAPALAQATRDPMLKEWFEREQAFDAVIAGKLKEVSAPAGLRDSILAGTKLSSQPETTKRSWWRQPWGMALAAAAAVAFLFSFWSPSERQSIVAVPGIDAIVRIAQMDAAGKHPDPGMKADGLGVAGAWLENPTSRLGSETMPADFAALRDEGCRTIDIAGREVLEICFRRETGWYHVYLTPREGFDNGSLHSDPMFQEQGQFAAASWADDKFVYVLAGTAGIDALRGLL